MTYTCIAKKGVHENIMCGLNEVQKEGYIKLYKLSGFKVEVIKEVKGATKTYTESQVKEMILAFYNEHILTTIEIGEKDVDNWIERKKM